MAYAFLMSEINSCNLYKMSDYSFAKTIDSGLYRWIYIKLYVFEELSENINYIKEHSRLYRILTFKILFMSGLKFKKALTADF